MLRRYQQASEDWQLRRELAKVSEAGPDQTEDDAWVRTMEADQWGE